MKFDKKFEWRDQLTENHLMGVDSSGVEIREVEYVPVFAADFGVIDELNVKVGLSFCDISGALINVESEASQGRFEEYKSANESKWDEQLSRILIEGADDEDKTIFYTSWTIISYSWYCGTRKCGQSKNEIFGIGLAFELSINEPLETEFIF